MTDFSENDLNRSWQQEELSRLSEKDLTKLALLRNIKNLVFFGVSALIISYIASGFGVIGTVVGWIAIALFGVLAIEPFLALFTTIISIFTLSPGRGWKLMQLLIAGLATVLYVCFALLIYAKMNNTSILSFVTDGSSRTSKKQVSEDVIRKLKDNFFLQDVITLFRNYDDRKKARSYFVGIKGFTFIEYGQQQGMTLDGYMPHELKNVIGFSLYFYGQQEKFVMAYVTVNP